MPTYRLCGVGDDGAGESLVYGELVTDNQDRSTFLRVVNGSAFDCLMGVRQISNGREFSRVFGPGTTEQSIPTGPAQRIIAAKGERGKWADLDVFMIWPYP